MPPLRFDQCPLGRAPRAARAPASHGRSPSLEGTRPRARRRRLLHAFGAAAMLVAAFAGVAHAPATPAAGNSGGSVRSSLPQVGPRDALLTAAGDIALCATRGDSETAALLREIPGTIATLGDTVYPRGSRSEFMRCFDPVWGRLKARTRPAVGNHEYLTPGASGYYGYFGAAAGEPGRGWYSYDLGTWHVVVLNSECYRGGLVDGCRPGSAQEQWLRDDLAAHPARCTLAYFHTPLFSSGRWGSKRPLAFWRALDEAGADVVLNGHEHFYERFAPQTPDGVRDPTGGIREFIVGTGGGVSFPLRRARPNSELRVGSAWGALVLSLRPGSYAWRFLSTRAPRVRDAGAAGCH